MFKLLFGGFLGFFIPSSIVVITMFVITALNDDKSCIVIEPTPVIISSPNLPESKPEPKSHIKMFVGTIKEIEKQINKWIDDNNIKVIDVSVSGPLPYNSEFYVIVHYQID
jgi:hypothetical protein